MCVLQAPKPVESAGTQSKKVFLSVNPDAAATEENILFSDGGEVQKSGVKRQTFKVDYIDSLKNY